MGLVPSFYILIFVFSYIFAQGLTLLEIKSTLNDTRNMLIDWQPSDESPCTWAGISCHPQDQRVISMYATPIFHFHFPHWVFDLICLYSKCFCMFCIGFCSNLPYMQLGGTISPSIGKLSRLQRL